MRGALAGLSPTAVFAIRLNEGEKNNMCKTKTVYTNQSAQYVFQEKP